MAISLTFTILYTQAILSTTTSMIENESTIAPSALPQIKWFNTLRIRLLFFFLLLFIMVTCVSIYTIYKHSNEAMEAHLEEKLDIAKKTVLIGIIKQEKLAKTLVDTMATVALSEGLDATSLKNIIPKMISDADHGTVIAGGGIWPEPYIPNEDRKLNSLFWGRNEQGTLEYYDDYNDEAATITYHQEEWYVPARFVDMRKHYWSRSYVDPYTQAPMITVTTPIIAEQKFLGAATIDLNLKGVQQVLKESSEKFNGYTYILDRNGALISPVASAESPSTTTILAFNHFSDLRKQHPSYLANTKTLADLNGSSLLTNDIKQTADALNRSILNTTDEENIKIAINIHHKARSEAIEDIAPLTSEKVDLKNDIFLNKPAIAAILYYPTKDWIIVTVIPKDTATEYFNDLSNSLILSTLSILLIAAVTTAYLINKAYLQPIDKLIADIDRFSLTGRTNSETSPEKGEIHLLNHIFTTRSTEILEHREKIKNLAYYDSLTSLPNKLYLDTYIESFRKRNNNALNAILFVDLDNFKNINDSLGHDAGDLLLYECGQRLKSCIRNEDLASRIGGDEFIIVFSSLSEDYKIAETAIRDRSERIIKKVSKPFSLNGSDYHIGASIGIHIFENKDANLYALLKKSDTAMYRSKHAGKSTYRFFNHEMQLQANNRLRIEEDLRAAIACDQLHLVYQPQIIGNKHDNSTQISCEALIRWEHPTDGNLSPLEFIAIAEESSLIISLGNWVIEKVCQQIKLWEQQNIHFLNVAINISPKQIGQAEFVRELKNILQKYEISSSSIVLEITEGVIVNDTEATINKIHQLRDEGFDISIDDFGTGYSSLRYLRDLPVNEIKIDRSFVSNLGKTKNDSVIVETIISMSEAFGYEVIAEGVESEKQLETLQSLGCFRYQGFYFSKPLLANQVAEFLGKHNQQYTQGSGALSRA